MPLGAARVEAMVEVGMVMVTAPPAMPIGTEVMIVMAVKANRSKTHVEGGIETPAERTVEDSISRKVRVAVVIRIPIPTRSVPVARLIHLGTIHVGFRVIR